MASKKLGNLFNPEDYQITPVAEAEVTLPPNETAEKKTEKKEEVAEEKPVAKEKEKKEKKATSEKKKKVVKNEKEAKPIPLYLTPEQYAYITAASKKSKQTMNGYLRAMVEKDMSKNPDIVELSKIFI